MFVFVVDGLDLVVVVGYSCVIDMVFEFNDVGVWDSIGFNGGEDGSSEVVNSFDVEGGCLDDCCSGESK